MIDARGMGMYLVDAAHRREIAELRKQIESAEAAAKRRQEAFIAVDRARKAQAEAGRSADMAELEARRTAEVLQQRQDQAARALGGGGWYFLNARHERQPAELNQQAAIAAAAAKRAQEGVRQQQLSTDGKPPAGQATK